MEKVYAPHEIERRIYERWESHGWFAPSGDGAPYCIVIPPPNVTGTLHMGHAFQHTLMDALTRYHRMLGDRTLWQPGTDHAGIATQMVVERQLNAQGLKRTELGREKFIERVWQWKEQSGGTITGQMRRLGDSVDWSRDRFTMDPVLSRAVVEVFVRLHEEGLIYRGKRLVNWDRYCSPPCPIWKWKPKRKTVFSGTSATHSKTGRASSSWQPHARKHFWATPRWP